MKRAAAVGLAVCLTLIAVPGVWAQGKGRAPEAKPKAEGKSFANVDPAEWVPGNALLYIGVTDVAETWEAFTKTSGYALMNDKAAAEALPNLEVLGPVLEALRSELAKVLDVPPEQLKNPFDGPLAFYLTAPAAAKPDDLQPGLIAVASDTEPLKTYYDVLVGKLKERAKHQAVAVGADSIDVFTREEEKKADKAPAEDDFADVEPGGVWPALGAPDRMATQLLSKVLSGEALPRKMALCLTADRLIIADTSDHIRLLLGAARLQHSLADSDEYKTLLKNLKPTGTVRFIVNLPRIVELAKAAAAGSEAEELRTWLKTLGADSLGSLVGHWRLGASSYDSKLELLFLMGKERTGLAKVLSIENTPTAPPASIPASASIYLGCRANAPQLLDSIEQLLRERDPNMADQMRAAMELPSPDGGTVNLRKDVLEFLHGPLTIAFGVQPASPDRREVLLRLAMGHTDEKALTRALGNPAITQMPLQPREAKGGQVFDFPPLPPMMLPGVAAAVTKEWLMLGLASSVEAGLAAPADRLSETESWKQAARLVPEQAWLVVYMDWHRLLGELLAAAEQKGMPPGGPDLGTMLLMQLAQGLAQSTAGGDAASEKLLKYAGRQVLTVSTTPEGVQFTGVQLKAEK